MTHPPALPKPSSTVPPRRYFGGFSTIPDQRDTTRYMRGDCGHMALALERLIPGSIIWKVGVGHFAVEDPQGYFWDIRGKMTMEQLWSGLSGDSMSPASREQVIEELNSGVYRAPRFIPYRETQARRLLAELLAESIPQPSKPRTPKL